MQYALLAGELLLAVHIGVGTGQHDPAIRGNAGVPGVPVSRFPVAVRIHRSDDYGAQLGSARGGQIRGHAPVGQAQNPDAGRHFQDRCQNRIPLHHGTAHARFASLPHLSAGSHQGSFSFGFFHTIEQSIIACINQKVIIG